MSNVKNLKNVNNAIMHKLDNEDRESLDNILVQLEVLNSFNQIITDYVDFQEFENGKDITENTLLTYYEIKKNKPNILTLLYESKNKLDDITNALQDLLDK